MHPLDRIHESATTYGGWAEFRNNPTPYWSPKRHRRRIQRNLELRRLQLARQDEIASLRDGLLILAQHQFVADMTGTTVVVKVSPTQVSQAKPRRFIQNDL